MEVSLLDSTKILVMEPPSADSEVTNILCSYGMKVEVLPYCQIPDVDSQLNKDQNTILVLDYQAPGMECLHIIRHIRKRRHHVPVIVIVDFTDLNLIRSTLSLNIGHFVPKPVHGHHLMAEVGKCAAYLQERLERDRMAAEEKVIGRLLQFSLQSLDMHGYLQASLELLYSEVYWLDLEKKGAVFLARESDAGPYLSLEAGYRLSPELHTLCARVEFGQCLCGRAAESGKTMFSACVDHRHDIRFAGMQPHGHYNVPFLYEGRVLGVMVFYLPHNHVQQPHEENFLNRVADVLSMGIVRRAQSASLKESERISSQVVEQLEGITKNISGIIFRRIDHPDGRVEYPYVSSAAKEMAHFPSSKLAEGFFEGFEMVHEADRKTVSESMRQAGKKMMPVSVDFRLQLDNGDTQWVHCSAYPHHQESGAICWDGMLYSIDERKSLEAQLLQSQKLEAVGQLAAGIAHEINTPTQYVSDNIHFLKDAFKDYGNLIHEYQKLVEAGRLGAVSTELLNTVVEMEEEVDLEYISEEIPTAIEQALEGLQKIATIVRAMKEFSHPGSDEMEAVDVNLLLANTITISKNEWKYVAKIETRLQPGLPLVMGCANQLSQVFLNMIVNAAHAIAGVGGEKLEVDGCIEISSRLNGDNIEVKIADNGPGIPAALRDKVFNPFFTTKEVGKGTGQGLAITHNIIADKHQGELRLEQSSKGGAAFVISLPVATEIQHHSQEESVVEVA